MHDAVKSALQKWFSISSLGLVAKQVSYSWFFLFSAQIVTYFILYYLEHKAFDLFIGNMVGMRFEVFIWSSRVIKACIFTLVFIVVWRRHSKKLNIVDGLPKPEHDENYAGEYLRLVVRRIVDSEEFATALRPVLPKGEDDKIFGFDYIPFLLANIDQRRERFQKSSQLFLGSTIALALGFSMIIGGLGFILVSESAVGDGFQLARIRQALDGINRQLVFLSPNVRNNPAFQESVGPQIRKVLIAGGDAHTTGIKRAISSALAGSDLRGLKSLLDQGTSDVLITDKDFADSIVSADLALDAFLQDRNNVGDLVRKSVQDLATPIARATTASAELRTPELLKRMAVGVIVASFFFTILRYMSGLYRDHHAQMIQAEQDDLAIRRFYIAFRCAVNDPLQRSQVLKTFMAGVSSNGKDYAVDTNNDFSPQTQELLKEMLNVIAKKAGA